MRHGQSFRLVLCRVMLKINKNSLLIKRWLLRFNEDMAFRRPPQSVVSLRVMIMLGSCGEIKEKLNGNVHCLQYDGYRGNGKTAFKEKRATNSMLFGLS